jgi:hypothetical protein
MHKGLTGYFYLLTKLHENITIQALIKYPKIDISSFFSFTFQRILQWSDLDRMDSEDFTRRMLLSL